MSTGKIVQVIGAVVDVEFAKDSIPQVYDALKVDDANLTLEVQQQLGDGIVRTIAMGSSDGVKRGFDVTNTGAPISVPVGEKTLGRIMNVLGDPVDEPGPKIASMPISFHLGISSSGIIPPAIIFISLASLSLRSSITLGKICV